MATCESTHIQGAQGSSLTVYLRIAAILQSFTVGRAMLVMSGASAFPRTVALAAVPMYHTYGFFSSCVRYVTLVYGRIYRFFATFITGTTL